MQVSQVFHIVTNSGAGMAVVVQGWRWWCRDGGGGAGMAVVVQGWRVLEGWRSGESTRLPPMWPGFDSQTRRHMWVEFVCSLLCTERFFSGCSGFPLSSKTNI